MAESIRVSVATDLLADSVLVGELVCLIVIEESRILQLTLGHLQFTSVPVNIPKTINKQLLITDTKIVLCGKFCSRFKVADPSYL